LFRSFSLKHYPKNVGDQHFFYDQQQSQPINKVPTRFDVYIKGNRNDIFATRGADIAILTGFGEHLFTKVHGFISNN
jgi:hypothetical protein